MPFLAQVDLRVDPAEAHRSPTPLPLEPNTVWEQGSRAALWLGPNEWLVLGAPGTATEIAAELEGAFADVPPLGDRRLREPSGLRALGTAREGAALGGLSDRPRAAFVAPGTCAQTLLGRVPVVLHERTESTGLLVRPSFAEHIADWLLDAVGGL